MAYQSTKPLATDLLSQSQADIAGNFTGIKTLVDINHVTFDLADQGKHRFIHLPLQTVVPATNPPATSITEYGLYNANNDFGNPAMFIRIPNSAAGAVTYDIDITTSSQVGNNGWTFLPSGILLKWGLVTTATPGNYTVVFPVAATIPVYTTLYSVQLTVYDQVSGDSNTFVRLATATPFANPAQFPVFCTERRASINKACHFTYLAIGV